LAAEPARHAVPREHPRLFGPAAELKRRARQSPDTYRLVLNVAREAEEHHPARVISSALVAVIDGDQDMAREAQQSVMRLVNGPVRVGHVPFGNDLALCAVAYDLCHGAWSEADRAAFFAYMNKTVDANVKSETSVFHNGWYGYKNWGIGLACYATYYENPRAPAILKSLEEDIRTRTSPALELAGDGGSWAEGYYVHYFLDQWVIFCEAARHCEGLDYYGLAPKFFRQRAIAGMFEDYPGIDVYHSRRPVPLGDGGGRVFSGERDKELTVRRILVNRFRDDPDHQAVHAYNETTPKASVWTNAYRDLVWRDPAVAKADHKRSKLSHFSPGAGCVFARSSWDDDATYFSFRCGKRFTSHQHLDVGHFNVYKHAELAGDGGQYDSFGVDHDVNYHLRTIAHSTMLIHDPQERWPRIRAGNVTGNDGGQHHNWPHHNGAVLDAQEWLKDRQLYDIADIPAFEDRGAYLYVAGDATRAYSAKKLDYFTRQIVYLRPDTLVIFDRVKSKDAAFKKTWLLQAMRTPASQPPHLVITNGKGRLFVQTLLPEDPVVRLCSGRELYQYGGRSYPPAADIGEAPACRVEVSPGRPAECDLFLHVLTAASAHTASAPTARMERTPDAVAVKVGPARITFLASQVGGRIELDGKSTELGKDTAASGELGRQR
jgi:hypothetical protein